MIDRRSSNESLHLITQTKSKHTLSAFERWRQRLLCVANFVGSLKEVNFILRKSFELMKFKYSDHDRP